MSYSLSSRMPYLRTEAKQFIGNQERCILECRNMNMCALSLLFAAIQMCFNILALYACAPTHEARGEDRHRYKGINKCGAAIQSGTICAGRNNLHLATEDEPYNDCPVCRGASPPQTP
ncbi:hypothetical protein K449DRAFT_442885 [Hypoxylon sp. EC38]|nr:hypothetical protein K449DRAFT_442885 [Hypoxylon sp. EC38]